jgi:hypothetical protein
METDGVVQTYNSFYEAAVARRLLRAETLWIDTASEAMRSISNMKERIRWMAYFLLRINPAPPEAQQILTDNIDFLESHGSDPTWTFVRRYQAVLRKLEAILRRARFYPADKDAIEELGLGHLDALNTDAESTDVRTLWAQIQNEYFHGDLLEAMNVGDPHDTSAPMRMRDFQDYLETYQPLANVEQENILDRICISAAVRRDERLDTLRNGIDGRRGKRGKINPNIQRRFFITGDGGTGKTWTYNVKI